MNSKMQIVLVEDDAVLAKVIEKELRDARFDVHHARDGEIGLKMVRDKNPDLLILDIVLPKKGGFELLQEIKEDSSTSGIPVFVLTMLETDEDVERGKELGVHEYIMKSRHAMEEVIDKIKDFFKEESHPQKSYGKK